MYALVARRRPDGSTELRTETQVLCADVATRRRFRAYWTLIKPASGGIRREMRAAVRSAAESAECPIAIRIERVLLTDVEVREE